ncbi:hypothetical protein [Aneurinibacillus terranovensis]|uniref:hypothetical protein n=1 Tax=Aneurinibacillus terranovensis TaxID=278991 RepID=UPI000401852F|nr:hypothetical protein [Aneurinibacillus terranovensis]
MKQILYFASQNHGKAKKLQQELSSLVIVKTISFTQVSQIARENAAAIFCWDEEGSFDALQDVVQSCSDVYVYVLSSFRSSLFLRQATAAGAVDVWVWEEVKERVASIYGKPPEPVNEEKEPNVIEPVVETKSKSLIEKPPLFTGGFSTLFALTGGKGGVGQTTIGVLLSAAVHHELDWRTAFLDFSENGDVSRSLCFDPRPHQEFWRKCEDNIPEQQVHSGMYWYPEGGFHCLSFPQRKLTSSLIQKIIINIGRCFDFILVDVGKGWSSLSLELLSMAKSILLVTTPTTLELRCSKDLLSFFREKDISTSKVRIVLNRSSRKYKVGRSNVEDMFKNPVLPELPESMQFENCLLQNENPFKAKGLSVHQESVREWLQVFFPTLASTGKKGEGFKLPWSKE